MKSKFKDSLTWAGILLSAILTVLVGILVTKDVNIDLFLRLTWIFIVLSVILTVLLVRVTHRMFRHPEDIEDKEA